MIACPIDQEGQRPATRVRLARIGELSHEGVAILVTRFVDGEVEGLAFALQPQQGRSAALVENLPLGRAAQRQGLGRVALARNSYSPSLNSSIVHLKSIESHSVRCN